MSNYSGQFTPNSPNNPWNKVFDLVRKDSTVLDVGCSLGNFGVALKKYKNCVVDGVEPDEEDAKKATKVLRKVHHGIIEEAFNKTLKDIKYDHIVFLDVIEHLYDPIKTLKGLAKHLNKEGTILFSIPNMAHASVRIDLLDGEFEYGNTGLLDNTHLHFYTKKEIQRVFGEAGYKVTKWDYTEAIYTRDNLIKQLNKIGVTNPNTELIDILSKNDARIFQYVGEASLSSSPKYDKRKHYNPDPQNVITNWYEEHDTALLKEISIRDKRITSLEELISQKDVRISEQERILNDTQELVKRIRLRKFLKYYASNKKQVIKKKIL